MGKKVYTEKVQVMVTRKQMEAIKKLARGDGLLLGAWARQVIMKKIEEESCAKVNDL